ncbi:MAG: T9SS type A sorting domain-containing protein [Bacteroidia bacterium]|nr:T9SS type A sorting domain-containing protein [Bacteroidia bacterium]
MKQWDISSVHTVNRMLLLAFLIVCFESASAQRFREVDDYGWARGENHTAPFLVDIDGNGLLDLIVGTEYSGLMRWEQSAGNPDQFRRIQRDFLMPAEGSRVCPVYHDLDGDGKLDLLLADQAGWVHHYVQKEAHSTEFTLYKEKMSDIKVWSAGRIWLGDLDGNGLLDIITGSSQQSVFRYEQKSTQSFEFAKMRDVRIPISTYYLAPTLHDIDGDGLLEMLLGSHDFKIRLLRQHAAVKDSFLLVSDTWNGIIDVENATPVLTDADGDGLLDMFCGSKGGLIHHYEQVTPNGLDGWVLRSNNLLGTWDFGLRSHSLVYDLDKDGRLDILRTDVPDESDSRDRAVQHFRQTAIGALTVEHVGVLPGIVAGIHDKLAVTDLDGDGQLDFFLIRNGKGMEHYRQRSGAPFAFDLVTSNFLSDIPWTDPFVPSVVDLDGNGKLDMLLFYSNNRVARLEQQTPGSLSFVMLEESWMNSQEFYPDAHILDYDRDGLYDMILGGRMGKLAHYRQSAANATTFEKGNLDLSAINVKLHSQPFVVDVNDDGRLDFVVGDGAGGLSLYTNEGPASVPSREAVSGDFRIARLSPNPSSGAAALAIELRKPLRITVAVYDVLGREVARPLDGVTMREGLQHIGLELQGLPAGQYSVLAEADGQNSAVTLIKH